LVFRRDLIKSVIRVLAVLFFIVAGGYAYSSEEDIFIVAKIGYCTDDRRLDATR
jgi:hypothetical protein